MRIIIDLQGAQSDSSRNRGIGRYSLSLAKAIAQNHHKEHEIIIALNAAFGETVESLRKTFSQWLPEENIVVWSAPTPLRFADDSNHARIKRAQKIREAFLASFQPDIILVTSLFEGFADDAVTSIKEFASTPTATILYDLIPLIHSKPYLENAQVKEWYMQKIESLKRADLMLSISESAREEALEHLKADKNSVVNISTAAQDIFVPKKVSKESKAAISEKYGLTRPFVMYTGGIDPRKNIPNLIKAYAALPKEVRSRHQLAIVCSMRNEDRISLKTIAKNEGLKDDEVIMTGFVPDDDLILLYNLCHAFIFPSWHEGFGLPALEAMLCHKAVIASNTSSLPEVVGLDEALFNPMDLNSITNKLKEVMTDDKFRKKLEVHAIKQSKKFSWKISAKRAMEAMQNFLSKQKQKPTKPSKKPKMAFISPLPPERSGISFYSAKLLPELSRYYDIELIINQKDVDDELMQKGFAIRSVEWFGKHFKDYERVIYHFGNSHFHKHMFDLIEKIPGVIVLHDFYLSGIIGYLEVTDERPGFLTHNLYHSHGYKALLERFNKGWEESVRNYPANLLVLQSAIGVIVHSQSSIRLREQWYGKLKKEWSVIPLLRTTQKESDKVLARKKLNIPQNAFVICSFGILAPIKQNHKLLEAFVNSKLAKDEDAHLIFVGEPSTATYSHKLKEIQKASSAKSRIKITGWVNEDDFELYLQAADIGVQLRINSRGETSAAVLDCMNNGLATIVNANGSMADLPKEAVWMLPDSFTQDELIKALEKLKADEKMRQELGIRAKNIIAKSHPPEVCAKMYADAIERFYKNSKNSLFGLIDSLQDEADEMSETEVTKLSLHLAKSFPPEPRVRQVLWDVTNLANLKDQSTKELEILKTKLKDGIEGYRIEPVYIKEDEKRLFYARSFTLKLLGLPDGLMPDVPADFFRGDIFVKSQKSAFTQIEKELKNFGVKVVNVKGVDEL